MSNLVAVTQHEGVAIVLLNNPPVNALSHAVRIALTASLTELFAAPSVQAIVIACEGRTFIAGADIREFGKPPLAPDLPELVEFLDSAPKPTIAAIHGTALGGGLELALACHFRVATESAKLGLPEVSLGILPGAGGTQRLPRLIGVKPALDMIVSGVPISAKEAQRLGLIDGLIGEPLVASALEFARRVLAEERAPRRVSALTAKVDEASVFSSYEQGILQRCRGFLAPFRCIEAVRAAVELPFERGLQLERELFRTLIASPESKAQRHVFFGERDVAKIPGLPADTPTRPVKAVAILGAGAGAAALARCFADARIPVTLLADTQAQLDGAIAAVRGGYASAVGRGRVSQAECDLRLARISPSLSDNDARGADLLIECVTEELDVKRAALARLDAIAKPDAILASSTAFLDLPLLSAVTSRPRDFVGLHFAEPSDESKLLEAVRCAETAPDAYATVMKLGRSLGKVAVPVRGHVASELLAVGFREALFLLEEGALPEEVDQALTEFGMASGPFAAVDRAGIEAALAERRSRFAELAPRERACTILEELAQLGRLGRSSGAGFYLHTAGRATPDPSVGALLERHAKNRGIERRPISADEITTRFLYSVVNAAARLLDAGVAARPLDIDMIWAHGYGFPLYRGGPLFYADQVGLPRVLEGIRHYRATLGEQYWTPAPLIERLGTDGGSFYGEPR